MKSTYLEARKKQINENYSSQKCEIENKYKQTKADIKLGRGKNEPKSGCLWSVLVGFGVYFGVSLLFMAIMTRTDDTAYNKWGAVFPFIAVSSLVVGFFVFFIWSNRKAKSYDQETEYLLAQEDKKCKQELAVAEASRQRSLNEMEKQFPQAVNSYRVNYIKNAAKCEKLRDWLISQLIDAIQNADRRTFIQFVEITLQYEVKSDRILATCSQSISILTQTTPGKEAVFRLIQDGNINNIPEVERQIGMARALAEIVKDEMERRMPSDPSDSTHYPAEYKIVKEQCDDGRIVMCYKGANGNFNGIMTM